MKQVFFHQGALVVDEVPSPAPEAGCVLVRTAFSCVSTGTELAEDWREKGLREELEAFHAAVTGRGEWPIPLWQQLQATDIALQVNRQIGAQR